MQNLQKTHFFIFLVQFYKYFSNIKLFCGSFSAQLFAKYKKEDSNRAKKKITFRMSAFTPGLKPGRMVSVVYEVG